MNKILDLLMVQLKKGTLEKSHRPTVNVYKGSMFAHTIFQTQEYIQILSTYQARPTKHAYLLLISVDQLKMHKSFMYPGFKYPIHKEK